ncbi:hypothetical protein RHGRI_030812 [Rhododendron griersonianum]|nr:hypothetical protein RHGRI_030812 [Rhododendron griersonianum]
MVSFTQASPGDAKSGEAIFRPKCAEQFHTIEKFVGHKQEIALNTLANRGPSKALASKVLVLSGKPNDFSVQCTYMSNAMLELLRPLKQRAVERRSPKQLKAFSMFENTSEALSAATLLIDSKPSKGLRKFLRAHCDGETLVVADSKLGNAIKEKLQIECIHNNTVMELMRGVRSQLTELIAGLASQDLAPMSLGLSHSLSQYKLKFSPDKVSSLVFLFWLVNWHTVVYSC